MFVSINKKLIYSILFLFLITSSIFVSTFYIVYGNKIQEEQLYSIQRNQQYIDLLYRNINITKEFRTLLNDHPQIQIDEALKKSILASEESQITELSHAKKQISQTNQSFDNRYRAIQISLQVIGISAILLIMSIILLGYLITRWVLNPINKISTISEEISQGNLKMRIKQTSGTRFKDELDNLTTTFNQMLDKLENVIEEVKDKEAFLQALIDSIPDGIRVIDKNYNIIIANQAYYKQIGGKDNKKLKCYAASQHLDHPCNPQTYLCPLHAILNNKEKNIRVVQQFAPHPERHLSINAAPLTHYTKKGYIVEAIRDLSDDINFSHQQKLSSLGFLSTSIAHEMKNQLGALRIIIELLNDKFYRNKADTDEDKKLINIIHSELLNCIEVPERLLKLTRGTSDSQYTECVSSIKDIISLLDFEAKSKGVTINFKHPQEEVLINVNSTDFKMVCINLILNALKAIDSGGNITVSLNQSAQKTTIEFTDDGIGIPEQNINRIFDPFFSEGHNSEHKGTGLGLSISKSIIEKSGGKISVKSSYGKGSTFSLSLPKIKNLAKS